MPKVIAKKVWPEYFEAIISGKKKFELRLNDFEVHEGDTLLLEEWNPKTKKYTGRSVKKNVVYVAKFSIDKLFWSKKDIEQMGLQIISIE